MLINRNLRPFVEKHLQNDPKIILLYGPRQAGKTTLIREVIKDRNGVVFLTGDDIRTQTLLSSPNLDQLRLNIGNPKILVIDEAQRIPNIGLSLKLLFDSNPFPIIASGSSSFDLANKINEPLTGRAVTLTLYPLSFLEIPIIPPDISSISRLEEFLRFGMYPKVITTTGIPEKQQYLHDLVSLYLYKDILTFESVRKPKKVIDLLTLIALQIGSEVSIQELSGKLGIAKIVVEKYLNLLEQMFVIINLRGFSRNLRKEITKTSKYYFVDLGLRNALIQNFNRLDLRNDVGPLFENYCIVERMKAMINRGESANYYFWRTYDQKEIDLIEEREGKLFSYEFKWSTETLTTSTAVNEFNQTYPQNTHQLVNSTNIERFLNS